MLTSAPAARATCEALREPVVREAHARLPENIPALADKSYALLKENPRHPSLRLEKIGRFWSVLVGSRYRALAVEVDAGLLWFWIGSHADYDALFLIATAVHAG